jgi:hypothetical protein
VSILAEHQHDPYLLPMPLPDTPVIAPHLVVARHAHLNSRYADTSWSWAPLVENPSGTLHSTHWSECPPHLQDQLKLPAWSMANGKLRPTFLKERGRRFRSRLSPGSMAGTFRSWINLAAWLDEQGVKSLTECDVRLLHEYGLRIKESGVERITVETLLRTLIRLWAFDGLCARPAGIARPPWDEYGLEDYLPSQRKRTLGENSTEPLSEETIGTLLCWAIRMVEDFADDILAAAAEARRLSEAAEGASTPSGAKRLDAFLRPLIEAGQQLPSTSNQGRVCLARAYIRGMTGASARQVQVASERYGLSDLPPELAGGACPLDVPITGRIADRSWREHIDFNEVPTLLRHLGTAAYVVAAYLTGIRIQEVLGMRAGCCPDPVPGPNGTTPRHLIRSHEFKTAVDDEGNHLSAGVEREVPWVAIAPVVTVIRLLERMVGDDGLLFDVAAHDPCDRQDTGSSLKQSAVRTRIADFIAWANEESARRGMKHEVIPPDPLGAVTPGRFRRTLAWHVARRPGGLVALAIQYGHMRTALEVPEVTGGYASRSRGGIHELIDIETVMATAETAAELSELFAAGGGVSGPAARAALQAAAAAPRFEGQQVKGDYARKYLARDGQVLYDNPNALLICRFKRDHALCQREDVIARTAPSLDKCVPGCGNAVRTDVHATQLRERAVRREAQAAQTPGPMAERLQAAAARDRASADAHDQTKITRQEAAE